LAAFITLLGIFYLSIIFKDNNNKAGGRMKNKKRAKSFIILVIAVSFGLSLVVASPAGNKALTLTILLK
jgi:hypothetical protein